ncbi:hypothetical protein Xtri_15685 [Xanthomonas campestris pv. trichodesmae]|uniref:Uncharacterized protein n=1 Tax=Xanthomonas citri pv. sesbaniae TaxID=473425 RepID=A0AAW4RLK9_XANCI|nr:hypothetical protein [Xanthomonas campestris pv. trichodesmae]MBZ3925138.1 hypothetical protein [Xanthomonas citri pv. sesbaniae]
MVMMRVVSSKPMPPCCKACELRPSVLLPISPVMPLATQSAMATWVASLSTMVDTFFCSKFSGVQK